MPLFFWLRSAATLLVVGALASSCAWHRVGPAQFERQLSPRLDLAVGLEPADGDTVASDVEFGQGVDAYMVAKALDDAQMEQVAAWALQAVASQCRNGRATTVGPAEPIRNGL